MIDLSLSEEEMGILMTNFRQGISHLMGERAYMEHMEARNAHPGLKLSALVDQQVQESMTLYLRIEQLVMDRGLEQLRKEYAKESEQVEDWDVEVVETTVAVSEIPNDGDQVQWIGEPCALVPGRLYQVQAVATMEQGIFLRVDNGYYRLSDFTTEPKFEIGYMVQYIGQDPYFKRDGVESVFEVTNRQLWGTMPYLVIATKGSHLSYPEAEFKLLDESV